MRRLPSALSGVAAVGAATALLEARPSAAGQRWSRTNHAGRPVSLLGGPIQAGAMALTSLVTGSRTGIAGTIACLGAGAMGAVDDHTEAADDRQVKGLRGHLGALRAGKVTTGTLKIAGIGASALAASLALPPNAARRSGRLRRLLDVTAGAMLIAGTANLVNLFDLRPGRALKVSCVIAAPLAVAGGPGAPLAAGTLGVAAAGLPDDLGERTMLGDTGANALGAALGTALAAHPCPAVRLTSLAGTVGLTLLSERVSFSRVIDETGALRAVDAWGRR